MKCRVLLICIIQFSMQCSVAGEIPSGAVRAVAAATSVSDQAENNDNSSSENAARPSSYDDFVEMQQQDSLAELIEKHEFIYLKPGVYRIDNPVIIERNRPLYLHGGSRIDTIITPKNPDLPLFVTKEASLVNLAGLHIVGAEVVDYRNFSFVNRKPLQFEMQDCFIDGGVIDVQGPGSYRLQATYVNGRGRSTASIVIDDPAADFLAVGGNMKSGGGEPVRVAGNDLFNLWQKNGRVRIYGAGVQQSAGKADFRFDTASGAGPHVLAYVRSEGTNGYRSGELGSALLYVPPSDEKVDVLMMANSGQWPEDSRSGNYFINYNAAGVVWMIGNSSPRGANHLAVGNAQGAVIVAMGNRIFSGMDDPFPIQAATRYNLGNTFSHEMDTQDKTLPYVRYLDIPGTITDIEKAPSVPKSVIPEPLTRPVLNRALAGMLDVKRDFGARGDGQSDDTKALQKAMTSGKVIYFPAGIYRTSETLGFSHGKYGGKAMGVGGWIAGAGKGSTVIRRTSVLPGSVFATEGMGYITIQGISFVADDYDQYQMKLSDISAVELEFNPEFPGAFATQEVIFYDCEFRGGRYAVSIGLKTGTMGSENMFINSDFVNARYGLAIGSYNALNNIAYGSVFRNNEITIGQDPVQRTGGSGALMLVDVAGTSDREIAIYNTSGEPWYFNGVRSDTGTLFSATHSSIAFHLVFDQCDLGSQRPGVSLGEVLSGGGLYFLYSNLSGGDLDVSSVMSALPVFSIHSNYSNFRNLKKGRNGRAYLLP